MEEISDWLTKIIIGLSLTQFHHIQSMSQEAAENIASALEGTNSNTIFFIFSYSIIVLYAIAGMISGYLWTRIEFRRILTQSSRELEEKKKYENLSKNLIRKMNNPYSTSFDISELERTIESRYPNQIELINLIVQQKPAGFVEDDPQKGCWGGLSHYKQ